MKPVPTWKYINKGLLAILGAFVIAAIASIVFLSYSLLKLDSLINQNGNSVRTVVLLQNLFIQLSDAESSVRNYIVLGESEQLSPYRTASKDVTTTLVSLDELPNADLPEAEIDKLAEMSTERIRILAEVVDARGTGQGQVQVGSPEFTQILSATREGTQLMDRIRGQVNTLSASTLDDISAQQLRSQNSLRTALGVAGAVSVLIIGLCGVLIWYFKRTIMQERALEGTKNEFLSLASHQLRTPATNVKQYVGLLLDGYLGKLTKKQKDALQIAYRNNEWEIRIMNDLLNVAKLDLKRIQLRKQRVNIVTLVKQVVSEYAALAEGKGQTLTFKALKDVTASVDRTYFKSVIEKLVDNAIKYSKDGTSITVSVNANQTHDTFEVVVKDRGLGIHKREVPKLFMKFSRLANEFSANSEGSGLGLYWVKQIMSLHDGTVQVSSQEGRGSKFTVRAPIA